MGFKNLFISLAIVAIFAFTLIAGGIFLASENGSTNTIMNEPIINKTFNNLMYNFSYARTTTDNQRTSFESEVPTAAFGSLVFYTITGVLKLFTSIPIIFYNLTFGLVGEVLGIDSAIMAIAAAILTATLILLVWRVIRIGG